MAKMTPRNALGARPRYVRAVPMTEGTADSGIGASEVVLVGSVVDGDGWPDKIWLVDDALRGAVSGVVVWVLVVEGCELEVKVEKLVIM